MLAYMYEMGTDETKVTFTLESEKIIYQTDIIDCLSQISFQQLSTDMQDYKVNWRLYYWML